MSADAIWQAFSETGDPVYYLLYQAVRHEKAGKANEGQART